jgi:hypothetical protein
MANSLCTVDIELSEKLTEELSHEQSSGEMDEAAEVIKTYFEGSTWEVCTERLIHGSCFVSLIDYRSRMLLESKKLF